MHQYYLLQWLEQSLIAHNHSLHYSLFTWLFLLGNLNEVECARHCHSCKFNSKPMDIFMGVYAKDYQEIIIVIIEDDEIAMKGYFLK